MLLNCLDVVISLVLIVLILVKRVGLIFIGVELVFSKSCLVSKKFGKFGR